MKGHSYRFTRHARADIDGIWESIAQDSPDSADRVIHEIYEQVRLVAKFPAVGHARKDLAEERPLLFIPVRKYMIAYLADSESIVIVRILHAARNLTAILGESQGDE